MFPVFVFAVCLFLRKKCIAETGLSGHLCWWQLYGMFYPVRFQRRSAGKGDAREMLCVPMQQLARIYHEVPEKLAPEEKEYIETLIDPQALSEYVRVNADPVKSGFHTEVMQIWDVSCGPGRKSGSAIRYLSGFISDGKLGVLVYRDNQYWISYILYDGAYLEDDLNILHITRNSHFQALSDWLREATLTPAFQSVPMLSVLLNQAFPFWLMLFAAGFAV